MTAKFILGLDYELFFGEKTGSAEHCLIRPVDALLAVLDRYGVKLSLFVDAGFLLRLRREAQRHAGLGREYERIARQLRELKALGHDVQLHIHPHWEDCSFDGGKWRIDTARYRLQDFSDAEIGRIVNEYKAELMEHVGDTVFAYRAGGWCIQPFDRLAPALRAAGIWLDSTLYQNGISRDTLRWFDFRGMPAKPVWRFSQDPLVEDAAGDFVEVPISAVAVMPMFFWKMALQKKLGGAAHRSFGDGAAMQADRGYYLRLLLSPSSSVVSIDGSKAALLESAYRRRRDGTGERIFNVIGHPKSLTPHSVRELDRFLARHRELESITFQDLKY
ncbi:MAG: hypothetical protein AB1810_14115, partial [Pseudomonadota bacterium]